LNGDPAASSEAMEDAEAIDDAPAGEIDSRANPDRLLKKPRPRPLGVVSERGETTSAPGEVTPSAVTSLPEGVRVKRGPVLTSLGSSSCPSWDSPSAAGDVASSFSSS